MIWKQNYDIAYMNTKNNFNNIYFYLQGLICFFKKKLAFTKNCQMS